MFAAKKRKFAVKKTPRDPVRYKEEVALAQSENTKDRLALAKSEDTHQEVLYYLAENDENAEVRKAVAKNLMTPVQASEVIAKDKHVDVRMALLKRLTHLLPDLSADEYSHLYAHAVKALSDLALDEVLKVRKALSATLKDKAYTPPKVAAQLAKDMEQQVSEPILKYCVAVPDEDLIDIVRGTEFEWAARAIAQREKLHAEVTEAVMQRTDMPKAGADALGNAGADFTQDTLNYIIEQAQNIPEWHKPLAKKPGLPVAMVRSIAGFVSKKIRRMMLDNNDIDEATRQEIEETAERRMQFYSSSGGKQLTALEKLEQCVKTKTLDEDIISDALALREHEFVLRALAYRAKMDVINAKRILDTKAPKPLVALCWRADLSMRFALTIQKEFAKVDSKELLYPKNGEDYPMDERSMEFQLEFFLDD